MEKEIVAEEEVMEVEADDNDKKSDDVVLEIASQNQLRHPELVKHYKLSPADSFIRGLAVISKYPLPVPENAKHFSEIPAYLEQLDSLDIVLFSCPISWYSMQMQGGRWTHVGMIYRRDGRYLKHRDKFAPVDNDPKILILESIAGKEEERIAGVDLVDAKKRLLSYFDESIPEIKSWKRKQYIGFRKLNMERTPEILQAFDREYERHENKPYEENYIELIRALLESPHATGTAGKNSKEDCNSLFCSELVSYIYQAVGVLPKPNEGGYFPNEYSPCDYSSKFYRRFPIKEPYTLEKEVIFGFPPNSNDHHDSGPPSVTINHADNVKVPKVDDKIHHGHGKHHHGIVSKVKSTPFHLSSNLFHSS